MLDSVNVITYRIKKECGKEFSPLDAPFQHICTARVLINEHGVCKKTTSLTREHLSL